MNCIGSEASLRFLTEFCDSGQSYFNQNIEVFFGNSLFTPQSLNFAYQQLHQVHGNKIVELTSSTTKADGHFTSTINKALIIKTADCLPVFLTDRERIMGLHIGWRGFICKIFDEGLRHFEDKNKLIVFIGPHIQYSSFEIDQGNATTILKAQNMNLSEALKLNLAKKSYSQHEHFYLDLCGLLKKKAQESGIASVFTTPVNTVTSPSHYSHRRYRWRTGLNYSYVIKKSMST